jgi:hypothetical protein
MVSFLVPRGKPPPVAKKPVRHQRGVMARSQSTPSELELSDCQSTSQATPSYGQRSSSVSVEDTSDYSVSNGPQTESKWLHVL